MGGAETEKPPYLFRFRNGTPVAGDDLYAQRNGNCLPLISNDEIMSLIKLV